MAAAAALRIVSALSLHLQKTPPQKKTQHHQRQKSNSSHTQTKSPGRNARRPPRTASFNQRLHQHLLSLHLQPDALLLKTPPPALIWLTSAPTTKSSRQTPTATFAHLKRINQRLWKVAGSPRRGQFTRLRGENGLPRHNVSQVIDSHR